MANWHRYLGPILCASLHAVTGSGGRCAETKQAAWRGKVVSLPSGDQRALGAPIRTPASVPPHDKNLAKYPFSISYSPLEAIGGVWGMSYMCLFDLFKFTLNRAGRMLFREHESDQVIPLLSHCT